jgi:hypothetical protein
MRSMTDNGGLGRADVARCWAGFASLGAGLVHLAVVQEHLAEWWVYGVFFAVTGAAQILWGLGALARDRAPFLRLVAAGNIALVALWATTRTVGIPIGPEPWTTEAVGRADVLCVVLELGTVLALGAVARAQARDARATTLSTTVPTTSSTTSSTTRQGMGAGRFVALMFAGALAVAAVTTPALAATESGQHSPGMPGMHM